MYRGSHVHTWITITNSNTHWPQRGNPRKRQRVGYGDYIVHLLEVSEVAGMAHKEGYMGPNDPGTEVAGMAFVHGLAARPSRTEGHACLHACMHACMTPLQHDMHACMTPQPHACLTGVCLPCPTTRHPPRTISAGPI